MKLVSSIVFLWLLASCKTPDRLVIPCDQLERIEVNDRGLFIKGSNPTRVISSKDSIAQICQILMQSRKVRFQDVNMKANQGLVEIYLYFKDDDDHDFTYTQTSYDGGIIHYSESFYLRNDSLINYLWYPKGQ